MIARIPASRAAHGVAQGDVRRIQRGRARREQAPDRARRGDDRGGARQARIRRERPYSLADINIFNSLYGLPVGNPELCGPELTPNIWRWLRTVYTPPGGAADLGAGQGRFTDRFHAIMEEFG